MRSSAIRHSRGRTRISAATSRISRLAQASPRGSTATGTPISSPTSSVVHSTACGRMAPSASSPRTRSLKVTLAQLGLTMDLPATAARSSPREAAQVARCTQQWSSASYTLSKGTIADRFISMAGSSSRSRHYLFHRAAATIPPPRRQRGLTLLGSKIYGHGFIFDDDDPDANPLATCARLSTRIRANPSASSRISAGEEVNDSARHSVHRRYVIDFGDMT